MNVYVSSLEYSNPKASCLISVKSLGVSLWVKVLRLVVDGSSALVDFYRPKDSSYEANVSSNELLS